MDDYTKERRVNEAWGYLGMVVGVLLALGVVWIFLVFAICVWGP